MRLTVKELLQIVNETNLAAGQRVLDATETEYRKRIDDLNKFHADIIANTAKNCDEREKVAVAACGEASFKAGAEQGRADALRDCWHVVASVLQEVAKRHELAPVREVLESVSRMARAGTIADVLAAPADPTPPAN